VANKKDFIDGYIQKMLHRKHNDAEDDEPEEAEGMMQEWGIDYAIDGSVDESVEFELSEGSRTLIEEIVNRDMVRYKFFRVITSMIEYAVISTDHKLRDLIFAGDEEATIVYHKTVSDIMLEIVGNVTGNRNTYMLEVNPADMEYIFRAAVRYCAKMMNEVDDPHDGIL